MDPDMDPDMILQVPSGSFLGILQLHNNYLGPAGTPGVFQKVSENI